VIPAASGALAPYIDAAIWAIVATIGLSTLIALAVGAVIAAAKPAASTRHALWFVALVVPAIAPLVIVGAMAARGLAADAPPTIVPIVTPAHAVTAASGTGTAAVAPAPFTAALHLHVPGVPSIPQDIALLLAGLWLAGALIGLAGLARSIVRVRGLKARSSPLEGTLADELPWLTQGRGREIYLRLSYELETPIAVGFRRPVILLPTDMATAAGLGSIEALVMHEYAHLTRYDDWTNFVQRAIERVFWFNPLVWVVGRRIALEREVAADEDVVDRTHDATNYASLLWRLAREMRMPEHVVVAPGALLTRKQISVRIERLLDGSVHPRLGVAAISLAVFAVTGVAAVAASAPALVMPCQPAVSALPALPSTLSLPAIPEPQLVPSIAAVPSLTAAANASQPAAAPPRAAVIAAPRAAGAAAPPASRHVADTDADVNVPAFDVHVPPVDVNVPFVNVHVPAVDVHVPALNVPVPKSAARTVPDGELTREKVQNCLQCDFSNADLSNLDLHGLSFTGTSFANANLANADLRGVHFTGVNFTNANLNDANLRNARISGADFTNANLDGADLTGGRVVGSLLKNTNIGDAATTRAFIEGCSGCNLQGVDLHDEDLSGVHLDGANLQGANLDGANLRGAALTDVNLTGATLTNVELSGAVLRGVTLNGVDFTGADLSGTHFSGSPLVHVRGADIEPSTVLGDGRAMSAHS
jgi:uncharacterized protein YjbI with pentapeptide repeats/beta-lactamase regulating signal transducer with metallopeptidase domain